jgi:hypothetical protein
LPLLAEWLAPNIGLSLLVRGTRLWSHNEGLPPSECAHCQMGRCQSCINGKIVSSLEDGLEVCVETHHVGITSVVLHPKQQKSPLMRYRRHLQIPTSVPGVSF